MRVCVCVCVVCTPCNYYTKAAHHHHLYSTQIVVLQDFIYILQRHQLSLHAKQVPEMQQYNNNNSSKALVPIPQIYALGREKDPMYKTSVLKCKSLRYASWLHVTQQHQCNNAFLLFSTGQYPHNMVSIRWPPQLRISLSLISKFFAFFHKGNFIMQGHPQLNGSHDQISSPFGT